MRNAPGERSESGHAGEAGVCSDSTVEVIQRLTLNGNWLLNAGAGNKFRDLAPGDGNLELDDNKQPPRRLDWPAYVKLDRTDSLLNPTTGYRAQLSVRPAHTFAGSNLTFVTNLVSGSTYWGLGSEDRAVLAGKLALGSLAGAPLSPLPADQRIYAGGGGSIRPYGYQKAGPFDNGNVPIGGRSSLVLNLEARLKIPMPSASFLSSMPGAITRARYRSSAAPLKYSSQIG